MEKGEVEEIKNAIDSLEKDVHAFSHDLKELVHEDHHARIDDATDVFVKNLTDMRGHVTSDNIEKAQEENQKMLASWQDLTGFYTKRIAGLLRDKEEVKSWSNWAIDAVHSWWFSDKE
jgi:regulator of replication initiation timing